jgi:hypothetical protein
MPTSICGARVPGKISVDSLSSGCDGVAVGVKECPITSSSVVWILDGRGIGWHSCGLTSTLDSWWFWGDGFWGWSGRSRRRKRRGRVGTPTKVFRIKCIGRWTQKTVRSNMVAMVIFWCWLLRMVVDRLFGMGGITVGKTRHGSAALCSQIYNDYQNGRDSRLADCKCLHHDEICTPNVPDKFRFR